MFRAIFLSIPVFCLLLLHYMFHLIFVSELGTPFPISKNANIAYLGSPSLCIMVLRNCSHVKQSVAWKTEYGSRQKIRSRRYIVDLLIKKWMKKWINCYSIDQRALQVAASDVCCLLRNFLGNLIEHHKILKNITRYYRTSKDVIEYHNIANHHTGTW